MEDKDYFVVGNLKIPKDKVITIEDWAEQNIVKDFKEKSINDPIAKQYSLEPLTIDDMYFTDEIEDDRINTKVQLNDYDWMFYIYDTRFPTLKIGTLSIRFESDGFTTTFMYVKQFLPKYITKLEDNYVIKHIYEFSSDIFDKYMAKDLNERYLNIVNKNSYAYNNGLLMLEWYNEILEKGKCVTDLEEYKHFPETPFAWESVRIFKENI